MSENTGSWIDEVPYDTRQEAIRSAYDAKKSSLALLKSGHCKFFNLKYKRYDDLSQIFFVVPKAINKYGEIFKRRLRSSAKLKTKECIEWTEIKQRCIIQCINNKWYLIIPSIKQKENHKSNQNTVALDPGIRTFQTFYSSEGTCGKIGIDPAKKILPLLHRIDRNTSKITRSCKKKRKKFRKQNVKLRNKAKNYVTNLHWQTVNYLCKEYDNIILPTYQTKPLVNKKGILPKKCKRSMLSLSSYEFKQKLLYKAKMYNKQVIICSEAYTSKTCGQCGEINNNLSSKKIFECSCGLVCDRDLHAARNILLRLCSYGT